ncbi:MAG: hypothetical protein ABI867_27120 [Kofleriaceae bacterium]
MIRTVVVVFLIACGGGGGGGKTTPDKPVVTATDDPTCPVLVAGTSVSVEDTSEGAAFVFVTTGDAAAVRTRAAALADRHNARHAAMGGGQGHENHFQAPSAGPPAMHQMGDMIGIHSTAAVTEVPSGARVTFTPASANDVAKLQAELRMHASHLGAGTCEM